MEYYTFGSFVSKKISLRTKVWGRRELALLDGSNIGVLGAYSYKGLVGESVVLQSSGPVFLMAAQNYTITGSIAAVAGMTFEARIVRHTTPEHITEVKIEGIMSATRLLQNQQFGVLAWFCPKIHPKMLETPINMKTSFEIRKNIFKYKEEYLLNSEAAPAKWKTDVAVLNSNYDYLSICSDDDRLLRIFTQFYVYTFDPSHDPGYTQEYPATKVASEFRRELSLAINYLDKGGDIKQLAGLLCAWERYFIRLFLKYLETRQIPENELYTQQLQNCQRRILEFEETTKQEGDLGEDFGQQQEHIRALIEDTDNAMFEFFSKEIVYSRIVSWKLAVPEFIETHELFAGDGDWTIQDPLQFCMTSVQGHNILSNLGDWTQTHFKGVKIEDILSKQELSVTKELTESTVQGSVTKSQLKASTQLLSISQRDPKFDLAALRCVKADVTEAEAMFTKFEIPGLGEALRTYISIFKTTHQAIYVERVVNRMMMDAGRYFILRCPKSNIAEIEMVAETASGGRFDLASEPGLDVMIAMDSILHFHRSNRKTHKLISKGTIQLWTFIEEYLKRIKLNWDPAEFDQAYRFSKIVLRGVKYDEPSVCIGVCQGFIFLHIFCSSSESDYNIHIFCQLLPTSGNSLKILRYIEQKVATHKTLEDEGGIGGHGQYTITFSARKTYFYVIESFIYSGNNQYLYYFKPGKSKTPGKIRLSQEFRELDSGWRIYPHQVLSETNRKTRLIAHKTQSRVLNFESQPATGDSTYWFEKEQETPNTKSGYNYTAKPQSILLVVLEFS